MKKDSDVWYQFTESCQKYNPQIIVPVSAGKRWLGWPSWTVVANHKHILGLGLGLGLAN